MIGIIVQLAISWLLLWLVEKKNLSVLGFYPTRRRITEFALFFFITSLLCSSGFFLRMYFAKETWQVNPGLTATLVLEGVWWNIKSVMFEELIFRGALFYILVKRLGRIKALVISSVAFGIYHWFSFEIIGDIRQMIIVFIITGIMGFVYAYGYVKTFSLYIPIAIHLGWNLTRGFIFSEGSSIGNGVFVQNKPLPIVQVSWFVYFLVMFFPMISTILVNFFILKRRRQV